MAYNSKAMQDDFSAWMAEAASRVQAESRFVEDGTFQSLLGRCRAFAKLNPATTVLLTAFAGLSALPLTIFFAFATLTLSTLTFFALGSVALLSFWIVSSAVGALLFTLAVAGFISSAIVIVPFNIFILYRLIVHITGPEGSWKGFSNWFTETRSRLGVPTQLPAPTYDEKQPKREFVF